MGMDNTLYHHRVTAAMLSEGSGRNGGFGAEGVWGARLA